LAVVKIISGLISLESLAMAKSDFLALGILRSIIVIAGFVISKNWFELSSIVSVTSNLSVLILLQIIETFLSTPPHMSDGTAINNLILVFGKFSSKANLLSMNKK
jgi:hypothetical protein